MSDLKYKIKEKLGEGYMGEVYRGWDSKHDREVALKFLPATFTTENDLARFKQESYILFQLDHPNIVKIHAFEENIDPLHFVGSGYDPQQEHVYFIVDEFIPGQSLREYIANTKVSRLEALRIAIQIAKALCHAHDKGVIHRDVKPENIMITPEGDVKVLDFGMAKFMGWFVTEQLGLSESERIPLVVTGQDQMLGTASYMSPEQWKEEQRDGQPELDERTDVWSLGVVLYELLTKFNPFVGRSKDEVRFLVVMRKPQPLSDHIGRGSRGLQRIVSKSLEKDRSDRYQTIEEMLADMEILKRHLEKRSQRNRYIGLAVAGVFTIVLVFFLIRFLL